MGVGLSVFRSVGQNEGVLKAQDINSDSLVQSTKALRLAKPHWSQKATTATTMLKPRGRHIRMERLVEMISQQFDNLKTLHLDRMEKTTDRGLNCLFVLHNLIHLDLI